MGAESLPLVGLPGSFAACVTPADVRRPRTDNHCLGGSRRESFSARRRLGRSLAQCGLPGVAVDKGRHPVGSSGIRILYRTFKLDRCRAIGSTVKRSGLGKLVRTGSDPTSNDSAERRSSGCMRLQGIRRAEGGEQSGKSSWTAEHHSFVGMKVETRGGMVSLFSSPFDEGEGIGRDPMVSVPVETIGKEEFQTGSVNSYSPALT